MAFMNPNFPETTHRQLLMEYLFLFCAALFIRLPFFFRDYIDVDESTFILMGQSIADGHLPYLHLWDLKPPLLFYLFGGIEYLFPRSLVAIRFAAVVIVFVSAVLLQAIARQHRLRNSFLIGLGYVLLSSLFGSLQGLMSEHVAVLFILLGLYFLHKENLWANLLAGIFFGCSLMSKLSYAYGIALLMVFVLVWIWSKKGPIKSISQVAVQGVGLLLPIAALAIPFLLQQQLPVFIDSVFLAPLAYAQSQPLSFAEKLANTWWIVLLVALLTFAVIRSLPASYRYPAILFVCLLIGTTYTFYASGLVNGHYLVMVYPFMLLLAGGILLHKEISWQWKPLVLTVLLLSAESHLEYYRIGKAMATTGSPYYRTSFKAIEVLKQRGLANKKILFTHYHISYWLLHQYPLTQSTTHPSNINRPFLFPYYDARPTVLAELQYLMDTVRPEVIVSKESSGVNFAETEAEKAYLQQEISTGFQPVYHNTKERLFIWQRK